MSSLRPIDKEVDIPRTYAAGPIGELLRYQNLDKRLSEKKDPSLLIGTCMDYRIKLQVPERFAFVLRNGGADLRGLDFKVSFAVAVAKIRHIAVIGHTQCAMANLSSRREEFVEGLVGAGWEAEKAEAYFKENSALSEIGDENDFTLLEAKRLENLFSDLTVAALIYKIEDHRLYLIENE